MVLDARDRMPWPASTPRSSAGPWPGSTGTSIGDGQGRRRFQVTPDHEPPRWPDPGFPQQVHLDITVRDIAEAEAQVLALGATRLPGTEPGFRVYADPAGHPFCLGWP